MQAITTKYLPATNTKPSRIKAECEAGSLTLPFSVCDEVGELRGETPDQRCAYALMRKLGWDNDLASGTAKDGTGVHVLMPAQLSGPRDEAYRQAAAEKYEQEGTLEIDDNAVVSSHEDSDNGERCGGAYVQAWVWVDLSEVACQSGEIFGQPCPNAQEKAHRYVPDYLVGTAEACGHTRGLLRTIYVCRTCAEELEATKGEQE